MSIIYTKKAKDDLVSLDWKIREKIINKLKSLSQTSKSRVINRMHDSDYYKIQISEHIIIGKYEENNFNIITVLEEKKIKFPE